MTDADVIRAYTDALAAGHAQDVIAAADALEHFDLSEYLRLTKPTALADAAHYYAERGMPVFPLTPGTKIPLPGSSGFKDATTDLNQITVWWQATPQANIGYATGHLHDVIDIDAPQGWVSLAKDPEVFDGIEAQAVGRTLTPSGGAHLFIPPRGDGNAAGLINGVDYRGNGGYVVLPPSRVPWTNPFPEEHPPHQLYRWAHVPDLLKGTP